MRMTMLAIATAIAFSESTGALAGTPVTPFDNLQPSLAVSQIVPLQGIYPERGGGGGALGDTLGFVYSFAGGFAPGGTALAYGQTLDINQNTALFSLLGTFYGGNGTSNFKLPYLTGQAIMGAGPSGTPGTVAGSSTVTLTPAQLPGAKGQLPFNNVQPSLQLEPVIALQGVFPTRDGSSGSAAFIGEIGNFAGNFAPNGWAFADGQTLQISQYTALYSVIGTFYGGNGTTNFDLPNLTNAVAVGAGGSNPVGSTFGTASPLLTPAQIAGAPVSNLQPSLAINYLIALNGIFPSPGGGALDPNIPILGQIVEFAGDFAPGGWAFADGQTLSISQYSELYQVIGTTYGGNGVTTFQLPDLEGRTMIGTGSGFIPGGDYGINPVYLTSANIPAAPIPEPETYLMLIAGLAALVGGSRWRRQFALAPPAF